MVIHELGHALHDWVTGGSLSGGVVDDLLTLLAAWGPCAGACPHGLALEALVEEAHRRIAGS